MKIIQTYNTFEDSERAKAGFCLMTEFKKYIANSYIIHKQIASEYKIYTDEYGANILQSIINPLDIEIIDFSIVSKGRYIYSGKMDVQKLQTEPYIHIDLDATLIEMPTGNDDVITEGWQNEIYFYKTQDELDINVKGIYKRPMSGLIGFRDIGFKDLYINEVEGRYAHLETLETITKTHSITLEETLLARLIIDNNKTVEVLTKFNHLREGLK